MRYLVDTGVWLRLFDRTDSQHAAIHRALAQLNSAGHELVVCPQNIAEFWNVSTRPASARGGYGKDITTTERRVQFIERYARVLEESQAAYQRWRELLLQHQVHGLATHDARLVSNMQVAGVTHILTLNPADFSRYPGIAVATPEDLVVPAKEVD